MNKDSLIGHISEPRLWWMLLLEIPVSLGMHQSDFLRLATTVSVTVLGSPLWCLSCTDSVSLNLAINLPMHLCDWCMLWMQPVEFFGHFLVIAGPHQQNNYYTSRNISVEQPYCWKTVQIKIQNHNDYINNVPLFSSDMFRGLHWHRDRSWLARLSHAITLERNFCCTGLSVFSFR